MGEPGAGKTTLAHKIEDINYPLVSDEPSTEGIAVKQWEFEIPKASAPPQSPPKGGRLSKSPLWGDLGGLNPADKTPNTFTLNLWDFGGQEIYHATHQFFLTKRSLYILVLDDRREDIDLHYWLEIIALLSDNSPTLIIKNEKQDRERDIGERKLQYDFPNIKAILRTNLATKRGLAEIISTIKHHSLTLSHIGDALPTFWVKVRQALEGDTRPHIDLKSYLALCKANGFTRRDDMLQLSKYLHDLGVCLHFQDDPLLKKIVILNPAWATTAVYKVLDNKPIIANRGRFSQTNLSQIWQEDTYQDMHPELLRLMERFKLCYQLKNSPDYIAPQLLSRDHPDYPWPEKAPTLRLQYRYSFMPKGIISQFIVATHHLIANQDHVWRGGVLLEREGATAEVIEHYRSRQITVRVVGTERQALLSIIRNELDHLHSTYPALNYQALIPCCCTDCSQSEQPYFFSMTVIKKAKAKRRPTIECQESFAQVALNQLLGHYSLFPKTSPLDKHTRLNIKQKEQETYWYDLSKRINAIRKDLANTQDAETTLILKNRLTSLETERLELEANLD